MDQQKQPPGPFAFIRFGGDKALSYIQLTVADVNGDLHPIQAPILALNRAAIMLAAEQICAKIGLPLNPGEQSNPAAPGKE